MHADEDVYLEYPEDWIDVSDETSHQYLLPTHATNLASRTTYTLAETNGPVVQNAPSGVIQAFLAVRDLDTELHEHTNFVHGIKNLALAQNRHVHILALKKQVQHENIDQDIIPQDVRAFARNYFKQTKNLFINKNGVLCARYLFLKVGLMNVLV